MGYKPKTMFEASLRFRRKSWVFGVYFMRWLETVLRKITPEKWW